MRKELGIRKTIAMVLTVALLLSCAVIAPKTQSHAAESGVTLDGATIRTDVNDGKQGLRFKITVKNAENVTECGILLAKKSSISDYENLTYDAPKALRIGTDKENHRNIYTKKTEEDGSVTIEYVASIVDIPSANYATDIQAKGYIKTSDEVVTYTDGATRNIEQVAKSTGNTLDSNGEVVSLGGEKLASSTWHCGELTDLDYGTYSGKTVNISFKLRMQGKVADGSQNVSVQINDKAESYPQLKIVPITNEWTTVTISNYVLPTLKESGSILYINDVSGNKNNTTGMEFYVDDFKMQTVDASGNYVIDFSKEESAYTYTWKGSAASMGITEGYLWFANGSDGYDNAFPILRVTLPSGKTLKDYSGLSLKCKGLIGDLSWKTVKVFLTADEETAKTVTFDTASPAPLGSVFDGLKSDWSTLSDYTIDSSKVNTSLSTFYMVIHPKCNVNTKFGMDDITFIAK